MNHFIDFFFLVSYIWFYRNSESQQFLVPGHPGSIRIGFLTQLGLKVRPVIGWSLQKLWGTFAPGYLASKTSVVLMFSGWLDVPILPLGALCGYRRWLVQPLYSSLLGVLHSAFLIGARKFALHSFYISCKMLPDSCHRSLLFAIFVPSLLIWCFLFPSPPAFIVQSLFYVFFPERSMQLP